MLHVVQVFLKICIVILYLEMYKVSVHFSRGVEKRKQLVANSSGGTQCTKVQTVQTRFHKLNLIFQVVSEESFVQIDEFYKLITPNADGDEPMKEQQMAASQHIVKFLEASPEAVVGTTCILQFLL